jgi:cytochrome c553
MSNQALKKGIKLSKLILLSASFVVGLIVFKACTNSNANSHTEEGLVLLQSKCYSCHNPTSPEDSRLAPPMFAVKKHYLKAYQDEASFVNAFTAYVQQPSKEKALMQGAVEKFGVMAAVQFPEEEIKAIASYIYQNDLPKPKWFDEHEKHKHGKGGRKHKRKHGQEVNSPLEKGKAIALKTKAALGKNLMQAINERGTAGAVEFCNLKALPITDSLAQLQNANIKRVSDKNRNPLNAANAEELTYILKNKERLQVGENAKPQIKEVDGKWVGYYPILTNAMCLQCHGKVGDQITPNTLAKLQEKYPKDQATGYNENELRGIWVVEF